MSDLPHWLTAIGTIGAVVVSLWLAGRDARHRATNERRRQAEKITGWLVPYEGTDNDPNRLFLGVVLRNTSNQLVYNLVVSLVSTQGAFRETAVGDERPEFRTFVGQLPPGDSKTRIEYGGYGMHLRFGVELAFQDAAGRYWLRRGDGQLRQVYKDSLAIYGISPPVPWESP